MQTTLQISGMSCQGCVRNVSQILQALPGVSQVQVSLEQASAGIEHGPETSPEALRLAVEEAGFDATLK